MRIKIQAPDKIFGPGWSEIISTLHFHSFFPQIHDLYEDFHITECPLLPEEVRGTSKVESFAKYLVKQ